MFLRHTEVITTFHMYFVGFLSQTVWFFFWSGIFNFCRDIKFHARCKEMILEIKYLINVICTLGYK